MKLLVLLVTSFFLTFAAHADSPKATKSIKAKTKKIVSPKVKIKTSVGSMTVELYPDKAPITVKNFLSYVKSDFYKNTLFHRIINNFMIQGGGFTLNKMGKPDLKQTKAAIKNEGKTNLLKNERGTIAMARTSAPHSATSQFFINHKNNKFLDSSSSKWGYTVFGKLTEGEDILDKIATVKTKSDDAPMKNIIIESIELIK